MGKELEALNDLWKRLEEVNQPMIEDYELIKSALERNKNFVEICKTKKVNIDILCKSKDYQEYNAEISMIYDYYDLFKLYLLTETEFNLSKEMMK